MQKTISQPEPHHPADPHNPEGMAKSIPTWRLARIGAWAYRQFGEETLNAQTKLAARLRPGDMDKYLQRIGKSGIPKDVMERQRQLANQAG